MTKFKQQLYIQDRVGKTLAIIGSHISTTHEMSVDTGSSTFDFSIDKNDDGVEFLVEGNYVIFKDFKGNAWCFTIMDLESSHSSLIVHCETLGLELLNKVVDAWEETEARKLSYYFDKATLGTDWEIGTNELNHMERKLSWEGRSTSLKRILSMLNSFDKAEIDFQVILKNSQVVKKVANIYKKRGVERSNVQFVYGDEVNDIYKTVSLYDFVTALKGVGGTPEGENQVPIDLTNHVIRETETIKGQEFLTYVSEKGDPFIRAVKANNDFNIQKIYLEDYYDYDTLSVPELATRTLARLKERSEAVINYEIDLALFDETLNLGDYVTIIDHDYKPALYLQARVLVLKIDYVNSSNSTAIFGNFLLLDSNISDQLKELQNQINNIKVRPGDTWFPWKRFATDDQGNGLSAFPAGKKYMAIIYKMNEPTPSDSKDDYVGQWSLIQGEAGKDGPAGVPGQTGVDGKPTYTWMKYADGPNGEGISNVSDNRKYLGMAYNKLTATESNNPVDYSWSLIKGEAGAAGNQGVPGPTGADGKPTYTWIKYSANLTGQGMTDLPVANTKFIGIATNKATAAESNVPADYTWSNFKGEDGTTLYTWKMYANDWVGAGISSNPVGKKYLGLATNKVSATPSLVATDYVWSAMYDEKKLEEIQTLIDSTPIVYNQLETPANPKKGDTWFMRDATGKTTGFFKYDPTATPKWQPGSIDQALLVIEKLIAVSIESSVMSGSTFLNPFEYTDPFQSGVTVSGVTTLEGLLSMEWLVKNSAMNGTFTMQPSLLAASAFLDAGRTKPAWSWTVNPDGLNTTYGKKGDANYQSAAYGKTGIAMERGTSGQIVNLTYDHLIDTGWVSLPVVGGYSAYVQYRKKLDVIYLRGRVTPNTGTGKIATVPVGYRINVGCSFPCGSNHQDGLAKMLLDQNNGDVTVWGANRPGDLFTFFIQYPLG